MYIIVYRTLSSTQKVSIVPSQSITALPPSRGGLEFGMVGLGMCENSKVTQVERTRMAPSPAKSWRQVTLEDAQALVNKLEWMPFSLSFPAPPHGASSLWDKAWNNEVEKSWVKGPQELKVLWGGNRQSQFSVTNIECCIVQGSVLYQEQNGKWGETIQKCHKGMWCVCERETEGGARKGGEKESGEVIRWMT